MATGASKPAALAPTLLRVSCLHGDSVLGAAVWGEICRRHLKTVSATQPIKPRLFCRRRGETREISAWRRLFIKIIIGINISCAGEPHCYSRRQLAGFDSSRLSRANAWQLPYMQHARYKAGESLNHLHALVPVASYRLSRPRLDNVACGPDIKFADDNSWCPFHAGVGSGKTMPSSRKAGVINNNRHGITHLVKKMAISEHFGIVPASSSCARNNEPSGGTSGQRACPSCAERNARNLPARRAACI